MRTRFLLLPLLAMLAPGAASACMFDMRHRPTPDEARAEARRAVIGAAAIIDGEVIRARTVGAPALVRAHRVFRGPRQAEFTVGEQDSCSRILSQTGERFRMILTGGPDVYYIFLHSPDEREVDRILRSAGPMCRGLRRRPEGDMLNSLQHPASEEGRRKRRPFSISREGRVAEGWARRL